ncbi:MAG: REP-associated tyrosine transposase [Rhodanobacteraceae bacterium]
MRRGRVSLPHHCYLVTAATMDRQGFFCDFIAGCAAARCFEDPRILAGTSMLSWVLMPDHAHWLLQLGEGGNLSATVNQIKSASARCVNRVLGRSGPLWERAFHDHTLRAEDDLSSTARYVIANPVRAGLVRKVGDYPFWNAIWL